MKRIICMLLVVIFCMYLPMPAFAATNSPSNGWTCSECNQWATGGVCPNGHLRPGITTPQTGDASMINIWLVVMIVALIALVAAVVLFRKNKKA